MAQIQVNAVFPDNMKAEFDKLEPALNMGRERIVLRAIDEYLDARIVQQPDEFAHELAERAAYVATHGMPLPSPPTELTRLTSAGQWASRYHAPSHIPVLNEYQLELLGRIGFADGVTLSEVINDAVRAFIRKTIHENREEYERMVFDSGVRTAEMLAGINRAFDKLRNDLSAPPPAPPRTPVPARPPRTRAKAKVTTPASEQ